MCVFQKRSAKVEGYFTSPNNILIIFFLILKPFVDKVFKNKKILVSCDLASKTKFGNQKTYQIQQYFMLLITSFHKKIIKL